MHYLLGCILLLAFILIYAYGKSFALDSKLFRKIIITAGVIFFTGAIIASPEKSFNAALQGLNTWFNIVCPSLLPFFIGAELMINLKVVDVLGMMLEPIMRPLFNVPGCGSFPFVMSITSGYPVGSKIVAGLYEQKKCSRIEAQRLLSFCSTSGPLFMMGAVGIGMLNLKAGGTIIAVSHYLGAITTGLIFKFYKRKNDGKAVFTSTTYKKAARLNGFLTSETKPLGYLLSEAVKNSVNSLLMVGGFIILFSVIINLLIISGFIDTISHFLLLIFSPLGIDKSLASPIASGLFEITIGSKLITASKALMYQKIIASSGIIAWGGFSIHAQVASMISNTDLSMKTYIASKLFHGLFSSIYAYLIIRFAKIPLGSVETFLYDSIMPYASGNAWLSSLSWGFEKFTDSLIILLIFAFLCAIVSKLSVILRRLRP